MNDAEYMKRALNLALMGQRTCSPNPMVGCVVVHNDQIIGEGWHKNFGGPHAEVMAMNSIENNKLVGEATVYVTLEPCSYHGKTPACTDLLLMDKPRKVVIGCLDPNPKVRGKGVEILKNAGIEVEYGVLEAESIEINKRFFVSMNLQRPYVILKWAQTADGFIARSNYDSKWISNEQSRQLVHKWRAEEDAILVGYNTVLYDNPNLNVRDWHGLDPVKVIIDPKKELDKKLKVFSGEIKTIWINEIEDSESKNLVSKKLSINTSLTGLLEYLNAEHLGSIIVEGGAATVNQFLQENLWDEVRIFTSDKRFEEGIRAPQLKLEATIEQSIENDHLSIIFNPQTQKFWQKNS